MKMWLINKQEKMQVTNKDEVKSFSSVSLQLIITQVTLVVLHLYLFKFQQTIKCKIF